MKPQPVWVLCPQCLEPIEVPIEVSIEGDWPAQNIVAHPDVSNMWMHVWVDHADNTSDEEETDETDE